MSGDSADHVLVARREIVDLVYRCCRIRGIDAGAAHRCGENVAHGEVHRGGSVTAFLDAFGHRDESTVGVFVSAANEIELAEAADANQVVFGQPVATAAVSAALSAAARRGFLAVVADQANAGKVLTVLAFERGQLDDQRRDQARQRELEAGVTGVSILRTALEALERHAASYLVAEADVDAAVGES